MAISIKQVEHIAKLARIQLKEAEKRRFTKELSKILDYMNKLNEIDTENIEPTSQVIGLENIFREDFKPDEFDPEKVRKLIGQAPDREDNFFKTLFVFEKGEK